MWQGGILWGAVRGRVTSCGGPCRGAGSTPRRALRRGAGSTAQAEYWALWRRMLPRGAWAACYGAKPHSTGLRHPRPTPRTTLWGRTSHPTGAVGSGRAALPVGSACRCGSRQETWGPPRWDTQVHSPPAPLGTRQPPNSLWGARCGRASVSPQGLWGTAQMLLVEPGFGAGCFRIPREDSRSLVPPHHHDTKAPRPDCREGDAAESRGASPTPVTASAQLNVPAVPGQRLGVPQASPPHLPPCRIPPPAYRRRRFSRNCSMVTSSRRTKSALPNSGPSSSAMPHPSRTHFPHSPTPASCAANDRQNRGAGAGGGRGGPSVIVTSRGVTVRWGSRGAAMGLGSSRHRDSRWGLPSPTGASRRPQTCHRVSLFPSQHHAKNPVGNRLFIKMPAPPIFISVSPVKPR